jgi:hypothetical protein
MNQADVISGTRKLADQLVALEAAVTSVSKADANATCRVCEKLRRPLVTLTGTAGFSALLQRALALAKREATVLAGVSVEADGSLKGLEGEATAATNVLVACLLSLLITFIGQTLTMRLLQEIWPDLPV